jgi:hypothetical protein
MKLCVIPAEPRRCGKGIEHFALTASLRALMSAQLKHAGLPGI